MRSSRCCSRSGCDQSPVATLTYIYAESTAVLGPLAANPEPHTYDLCQTHALSLTTPRGWELVRHEGDLTPPPAPADDLLALADAVREPAAEPAHTESRTPAGTATRERPRPSPHPRGSGNGRRGHLRSIPPPDGPRPR